MKNINKSPNKTDNNKNERFPNHNPEIIEISPTEAEKIQENLIGIFHRSKIL